MRSLDVKFKSNESEHEAFRVTMERQAPAGWIGDADSVMYFQKGVDQTFLLEQGQRLVIEPWGATVEMVLDKDQNAVMPKVAFDTQPTPAEKQQMELDRQKELRDIQAGKIKVDRVAGQAANQARDEAIQKQMEADTQKKVEADKKITDTSKPVGSSTPALGTQPNPPGGTPPGQAPNTGGQDSKDVKK